MLFSCRILCQSKQYLLIFLHFTSSCLTFRSELFIIVIISYGHFGVGPCSWNLDPAIEKILIKARNCTIFLVNFTKSSSRTFYVCVKLMINFHKIRRIDFWVTLAKRVCLTLEDTKTGRHFPKNSQIVFKASQI